LEGCIKELLEGPRSFLTPTPTVNASQQPKQTDEAANRKMLSNGKKRDMKAKRVYLAPQALLSYAVVFLS
jgi:hypothetical protein